MIKSEEIKQKRKDKRVIPKSKILQAGEKLFAQKGFYLTTLEEIASGANLAKGTIYLYFKNKTDLFISIIERKLDVLLRKIKQGIEEEASPVEEIKKTTRVHLKFLEQNRNFFKILQSFSEEYKKEMEKELTERVIKKNTRYLEILQHLFEKAIEHREVKPLNARKLAVILIGIVHSLTINWISQGEKDSLYKDHDLAWEIFWNGAKLT